MGTSKYYLWGIVLMVFIGVETKAQDYDYIKPFTISREVTSDMPPHILKIIITHYANLKDWNIATKDIESVEYVGTYKLKGIESDSALVFKFSLNYSLPMVYWPYTQMIIINKNSYKCYFVQVESVEPIKIKGDSDVYYFAGRYKNRYQYGIFKIYEFKEGILTQIFQSSDCVSNFSFDCMSYENGDLDLENIDINDDGYLDLKFTGIKNFYCHGLETYGREDKDPIRQEPISIIYYFQKLSGNWTARE